LYEYVYSAPIAQWIEYPASNRVVTGSSPVRCMFYPTFVCFSGEGEPDSMIPILALTQKQYADAVHARFGKGSHHASMLYSDWFRTGLVSHEAAWIEKQARPLVQGIIQATDFFVPERSLMKIEGHVTKFLLRFEDGLESESVIIPMKFGNTLCISSQVGCKMGCAFCETGKMGLIRSLSPAEIIAQVYQARFALHASIRNIVFMGMGEPFDNYDGVMQAIRVLTCEGGLGLAPSKMTVSTSGKVDSIYRFMEEADPAVNLAVSMNAPNDTVRDKLMPVNRQWNMAQLKQAMIDYCRHPRREILIEYVLIQGVNDSLDAAQEVVDYLSDLRVKINLIPYNPQSRDRFAPPSEEALIAFRDFLRQKGFFTLLRGTKGQSIMAACGQLGNREVRKTFYQKSRLSLLRSLSN
jgi:23S rRNA (adenine2503-C2)-methyltransferase